jgi:hypothetical protein
MNIKLKRKLLLVLWQNDEFGIIYSHLSDDHNRHLRLLRILLRSVTSEVRSLTLRWYLDFQTVQGYQRHGLGTIEKRREVDLASKLLDRKQRRHVATTFVAQ